MWLCEGTYDIDWNAVSAVGTMLAVVVALWFSLADQRDRRRREHTEAKIIATRIRDELADLSRALDRLSAEFSATDDTDFDSLVAFDLDVRDSVVRQVSRLATPVIDDSSLRMHALPLSTARSILGLLSQLGRLRMAAAIVHSTSNLDDPEDATSKAAHLRIELESTTSAIKRANDACRTLLA